MKGKIALLLILSFAIVSLSFPLRSNEKNSENSIAVYPLGCIPVKLNENVSVGSKPILSTSPLPSSWDWRNYLGQDWTTPVKNQGNCGSCWDFAAMGALEAIIKIREGCASFNPDLSEQYLLSCPPDSGGCGGWNAYNAYKYIFMHGGALLEDCFPYKANDDIPCSEKCSDWKEKLIPIIGYGYVPNPGRDYMKRVLVESGPFVVDMAVYNDFFSYNGGVYEHPGDEPPSHINHQVVLVGYDDAQQCWICKNSWGKYWGENGFFRIKYGDCQIEYAMIYVNYDASAYNWPPVANAGGPYFGHAGDEITFNGNESVDPDGDELSYIWQFGDGSVGYGSIVKHAYLKEGIYTVNLTIVDVKNQSDSDHAIVYIDDTSPDIQIIKPKEGCIYFFDNEYAWILGRIFHKPIAIGGLTIFAQAKDNIAIDRVEFYIDDKLAFVDKSTPYLYYWENATNGEHIIKVIAYDKLGNKNEESINVLRFG